MNKPNWNHVVAPNSKKILVAETATRKLLFAAHKEMHDAFMKDAQDPIIDPRVIYLRELAIDALDAIITVDNDDHIDYNAAVDAVKYYWSDGQHGYANPPKPETDVQVTPTGLDLDPSTVIDPELNNLKSECKAVYDVLTVPDVWSPMVLDLVASFTWLRNEMSERCDIDDFDDQRWEDMQTALNAADEFRSKHDVVNAIRCWREYWSRWERYSE